MIVGESTRGRRLIGRLDKGVELLQAIAEVSRVHNVRTASLVGLGALDQVTVCEYDQRARVYKPEKRFEGMFEVLNLTGNVSTRDDKPFVHAHITVSRERDNGIELLGGHLLGGRVFAFEFTLDVLDDLVLKRTMDAPTGLQLWSEAIGGAVPGHLGAGVTSFEAPVRSASVTSASASPPPEVKTSWQEVAAASAPVKAAAPASEDEVRAKAGDLLDHAKFGRCVVERIEGDYEFVQVRLRNQRLIRLSLDVLTLALVGTEAGQRVFKALPSA